MLDPLILARFVHIAATVLACGAVCFVTLVAEPAARAMPGSRPTGFSALRERLTLVVFLALAVAIASGAIWLVLTAAIIYDASVLQVLLQDGVSPVLADTRFGQVALARLMLALLLAALLPWPATQQVQLAAATLLVGLLALVGHAGATPDLAGRVQSGSDIMHLLAASAWLGGLPTLVLLLSRARRGNEPAWLALATLATKRFSLLGIVTVAVLLASGVTNSWYLVGSVRDLVATDYGRLVLLKIVLFVTMVAVATANRYRLTPRLPAPEAMRMLQHNSLAETGLGLCVLLVVAALGTMPPAAHFHHPSAGGTPEVTYAHIHGSEVMADVIIDLARPGPVRISTHLTREDGSNYPARAVVILLTPQASGPGASISHAAKRLPDDTWEIERLEIGQPGIWTLAVTVTPGSGESIVLDAPVVIDR